MHPAKRLIPFLHLVALGAVGATTEPAWKDIEAAANAADFVRLRNWVMDQGPGSTTAANVLIAASRADNPSLVDRLLALKIPPAVTNVHGVSPLLNVAQNGQTEMVRHLLKVGANPNTIAFCSEKDCQGHTPLLWAVCRQNLSMAKMLLDAGADPRAANDSATRKANACGDVELFLLLKQFGGRESRPDPAAAATTQFPPSVAWLGLAELLPPQTNRFSPSAPKLRSRLSVIGDDRTVALADLLSAELAADPVLEMIERQELERILGEQQLTRQFAADSANYGRVAELLRADALLLLNERALLGNNVIESRLVRVNPGLVLDTAFASAPVPNPGDWARRMKQRIAALAGKTIRDDAIALSFVSIRSSIHSSGNRGLDRTLAVLLNERLARQPHFVCLERSAMERLGAENTGPFRGGNYLVDGNIEPSLDGSGAFSMTIRFNPLRQGEACTFTCVGRRDNPAAAIDTLLKQINARLVRSSAPLSRNLAEEAREYLAEATWALDAQLPALAQSAAEAAWALGLREVPVARLRALAAMRMVRDQQDPAYPGTAAALDVASHGLTVWQEAFHSDLLRNREAVRNWLEFGLQLSEDAVLGLLRLTTASEQLQQADRLDRLRQLVWSSFQEVWTRSAELPPDSGLGNAASEKQAAFVRLLFPQTKTLLPAVRDLLARKFTHHHTLTRARIRSNLALHWSFARVMVPTSRTSSGSVTLSLPPGEEASRELALELRNASAPEDRYLAALLMIRTASSHHAATQADLDRLRNSLLDLAPCLAEGGEIFRAYWERFENLDNLHGVPFFAINRTYSPNRDRMWERHTPEHTEFRRQLFLRLAQVSQAPSSDFHSLISPDQYTPEQAAEVVTAQARLGNRPTASAARPSRAPTHAVPPPPSTPSPATPPPATSAPPVQPPASPRTAGPAPASPSPALQSPTRPLLVQRLWHPFDLGLNIVPEFRADFVTMTAGEGRIWLHACTLDRGGQPDKHFTFAIDPETMRTETIPVPERSSKVNARILVTARHLVFIAQDFLAVRNQATGVWDTYKEIKPAGIHSHLLVKDQLYLLVNEPPGNALIAFDLNKRGAEVLTSSRRRPAASPFDDPGLEMKSLATNATGDIVVSAGKIRQAWNPARRTWAPLPLPAPGTASAQNPAPAFGRVGTVGMFNGVVGVRFQRADAPMKMIPLAFSRPAHISLPDSRYGPQNIRPDYCNAFPGGLLLVPSSGSGFWIITQGELDAYARQSGLASTSSEAAAR